MPTPPPSEIWIVVGSQHLYGPGPLKQVEANARKVAAAIDASGAVPAKVVFKGLLTTPEQIREACTLASSSPACAGLLVWMHTFSPAKMWIGGLSILTKPLAHLHTQFNRDLPWGKIDMDFMNLNQAAHGDREAGHLHTRLGLARRVIVGHWSDRSVLREIGDWARVSLAWHDLQGARFVRFGDNMRSVAVTEGDKVEAEARFGFSVNTVAVGDLARAVQAVADAEVERLCRDYDASYRVRPELRRGGSRRSSLREAARIELGLRAVLADGGYKGFTTTFEDLHGLRQLPGLAVQRLMAEGYGFGAEGDWKTAALLRASKVMASGLGGGTSFMEDYTYHLAPGRELVLGAHMLEVCPSIADGRPSLEVHPLSIGGKEDPARLVFTASAGEAVNATLVDLGHRFRLVVNEVRTIRPPQKLPRLPVARAVWRCKPDFRTACASWIRCGGAHHTVYSTALGSGHFRTFADIAGIEFISIGDGTSESGIEDRLRWNEAYFGRSSRI
jgi:L-arabinose isomerase